jgi:AmmeMemoRadiSam system radical SAM enzyme
MDTPRKTLWWHAENGTIVCDLCPRGCKIPQGSHGFCFVRENAAGQMVLSTYGKSTGFCIDPIEKKPLNHFLPGTPVLSFGTAGCNLGCKFCQNWDISKSREVDILCEEASPEAIARAAKTLGCRSIAFTYNDPIIWAEYAIDTAVAAHAEGIKTVAVTSGYMNPESRAEFYNYMDAANVDLKAFTDDFYRKQTLGALEPVLDTLKWLKSSTQVWFEITTLLIPDENDSVKEIQSMCEWLFANLGPDVPLHFTAFHPDYKMTGKHSTPQQTLIRARNQALAVGLNYVYTGNVLDRERQSTYCPNCHSMLIERDHYELGRFEIRNGKCSKCSTVIPGVFDDVRGTWGARRMPVQISDY